MAITRFQDLPSTNTPINSTNLNGNFDELGAKVGTSIDSNYKTNILYSKNLCDISKVQIGKQWNGGNDANTATVFVPVKPSTTYTISFGNGPFSDYYLIEKNSESDTTAVVSATAITSPTTRATNASTYCLALSFYKSGSAITQSDFNNFTIQVEENGIQTPYETYVTPTINVDGEDIYVKGQNEVYSTTEQRIGTWLGKPLYRRVFEIPQTSINSSDVTVINFNLADTNYVTKIEGMIGVTTSNTYYPIFGSPNRANVGYQVRRVSSAIQIIVDQTMSAESSIKGGQMIVEYTKTTD